MLLASVLQCNHNRNISDGLHAEIYIVTNLLVGRVAAVAVKYQVLPLNTSGKRDTTSIYYKARRDYWYLL
jgi:hypothetical protein